ncbi:barstar family protein [Streptomyces sp. CA-294286]|uniref:barstar family protein n=1 Tax=Streptomyces sp. CA-294286 TaxID=3240070 RepID=UPI003D8D6B3F
MSDHPPHLPGAHASDVPDLRTLTRSSAWAPLDADGRRRWLVAVREQYFSRTEVAPDTPAGAVHTLAGRYITDRSALFLALGEAVNGPGGYFGADLDALNDCLRGGFGATTPFTLDWPDSATARTHLVAYFDSALDVLRDHGVDVRLR